MYNKQVMAYSQDLNLLSMWIGVSPSSFRMPHYSNSKVDHHQSREGDSNSRGFPAGLQIQCNRPLCDPGLLVSVFLTFIAENLDPTFSSFGSPVSTVLAYFARKTFSFSYDFGYFLV